MTRYDSLRSLGISVMNVFAMTDMGKIEFEAATYNEILSILGEYKRIDEIFIDDKQSSMSLIHENAYLEKAGML